MNHPDPRIGDGPSAGCRGACPHFEPVSGSCGRDLRQAIASAFRDSPGVDCPVYGTE